MEVKSYSEIINIAKKQPFVIYGAGGHGRKFLDAIIREGVDYNFRGFVVSDNTDKYKNAKLVSSIDKGMFVFISAHTVNVSQMIETLRQLGHENYCAITSFLLEICCGTPVESNVLIDTYDFMQKCHSKNYLTIIEMAINYIDGKNDYGKRIYTNMFSITSDEGTALKRFFALYDRTAAYRNGITEKCNIKVNVDDKFILDGAHRFILSYHYGIEKIPADIYTMQREEYNKIFHQEYFYSANLKKRFTSNDFDIVMKERERIFE